MAEYQRHSSNHPLLFGGDFDALSASIYDGDLIPILDREDNSDLSHYESSRCSSISNPSLEWICPLKYSLPSCNRLFDNAAYQMPRAPPPTPLPTSPNVLPRYYNEEGGIHLEIPAFELGTSLKELGLCAAMGNQVLVTRPWWGMANVEDPHSYSAGDIFKSIPEPCSLPCAFCDLPVSSEGIENGGSNHLSQTTPNDQVASPPIDDFGEEHKSTEPRLYQFPPPNSYRNPRCPPPTPPPSECSNRSSFDEDQEEITLYSFLRQPYSMVEIDYQLQLLFIQQQAEQAKESKVDLIVISELDQPKRGSRLRKASLSSIEKAGGTLKRKISSAIKRSLSR